MYVQRVFNPIRILMFSVKPVIIFAAYASIIASLYAYCEFHWLKIPWVPLASVGVAVAFYIGFKNNSAYDRTWEARKIWGGIVNSSRSWGSMVSGFITNEFTETNFTETELEEHKRRLIYRHIAWTYRLKRQLRVLKPWEHDANLNRRYRKYIEELFPTDDPETELKLFLADEEVQNILNKKNACTRLFISKHKTLKN